MKAIRKSPTRIQLEFDNPKQREDFANLVSYEVPGYQHTVAYKSGKWSGKKSFITPTNTIAAGLFKSVFMTHATVYDTTFKPVEFDDIPLYQDKSFDRRQYQLDAINSIFQHTRGLVNHIMGAGKSITSAAAISYHLSQNPKHKVLFVVYDKNILDQTMTNFTNYKLNPTQFGSGTKNLTGSVVVATIQSLNKIENPKEVLKDVSFVIFDEAHHSGSRTSRQIITKLPKCKYFIGLTATPHIKKSIETAELMAVLGPIISSYGYTSATEDKKIVPVKAFFLDIDPDWDVKEQVFDRKHYKYIWDTAIQNNTTRNKVISDILDYTIKLLETPSLVLVDRTEHGTALCETFKPVKAIKAMTMFGEDDIVMRAIKKGQLQADNLNVLVSTVCKEGSDFAVSPVVAVNASGRKSFISTLQFLGRITRKNEKFKTFRAYIDFVDHYHPFLRAHSYERIKACEEFGIEVVICKSIKELIVEIIKHYKLHTFNRKR